MSSDKAHNPIYSSGHAIPTIAPQNSPFLAPKKKRRISILPLLSSSSRMSPLYAQTPFQLPIACSWHFDIWSASVLNSCGSIPHVLQHDEDPMVEDLIGTWAGIFPLSFPSYTNTIQRPHSLHFCNHKYQELVQGEFLPSRKSFKHSLLLSLILFIYTESFSPQPPNFPSPSFHLRLFLTNGQICLPSRHPREYRKL